MLAGRDEDRVNSQWEGKYKLRTYLPSGHLNTQNGGTFSFWNSYNAFWCVGQTRAETRVFDVLYWNQIQYSFVKTKKKVHLSIFMFWKCNIALLSFFSKTKVKYLINPFFLCFIILKIIPRRWGSWVLLRYWKLVTMTSEKKWSWSKVS